MGVVIFKWKAARGYVHQALGGSSDTAFPAQVFTTPSLAISVLSVQRHEVA